MRTRYIQDRKTGKLIPAAQYRPAAQEAPGIMKPLEPFVSPVDGTTITDRAQLRAHNKRHNVTDSRDYGPNWFDRKRDELEQKRQNLDPASKMDRIEALKHAVDHHRRR